jgi:hypothetical protein
VPLSNNKNREPSLENMKIEQFAGHNEAKEALVLSSGGDGNHAD